MSREDADGNCLTDTVRVAENEESVMYCGNGRWLDAQSQGSTVEVTITLNSSPSPASERALSISIETRESWYKLCEARMSGAEARYDTKCEYPIICLWGVILPQYVRPSLGSWGQKRGM